MESVNKITYLPDLSQYLDEETLSNCTALYDSLSDNAKKWFSKTISSILNSYYSDNLAIFITVMVNPNNGWLINLWKSDPAFLSFLQDVGCKHIITNLNSQYYSEDSVSDYNIESYATDADFDYHDEYYDDDEYDIVKDGWFFSLENGLHHGYIDEDSLNFPAFLGHFSSANSAVEFLRDALIKEFERRKKAEGVNNAVDAIGADVTDIL
jgi:hypothetical protein